MDLFSDMISDPDWLEHQRRQLQTREYKELLHEQRDEIWDRKNLPSEQKAVLSKAVEDKIIALINYRDEPLRRWNERWGRIMGVDV
jgi:hypothetical protein